jgi:Fe-S oxidoreductase
MDKKSKELIPAGLRYIANNIITKENIIGVPKSHKAKWAKELNLPRKAETIFFAGCGYQFMNALESMMSLLRKVDNSPVGIDSAIGLANLQKKVGLDISGIYAGLSSRNIQSEGQPLLDAVRILKELGLEFAYLADEEPCCGGLLYYTGMEADFRRSAEILYDKLKNSGVKQVIGIVPSCTFTLKSLIPKYISGFDLKVEHFLEIVARNIKPGRLSLPEKMKVVYHDPCQLARYLGIIEEPRKILRSIEGIELVETSWTNKEWSTCCGGGGGFEAVFPELSHILAVNRAKELVETGAQTIVTNCPGCIIQLKNGLKELGNDSVKVLDITEMIVKAMGLR